MTRLPRAEAPSKAAQKPMNGPKEKGKRKRSSRVTPAAVKRMAQIFLNHAQESAVSSQRMGRPEEPEVWWKRR